MRFIGAVWYQGEANAGDPSSYSCRFPAMITDWRLKFGLPQLSFFYVQLAAYGADYSLIRAAQDAALWLPMVGRAIAIDLGDPTSPAGSIHPRRKQEVGRRLSLAARAIQYGERSGLVYKGPTLSCVQLTPTGATIAFEEGTADGLHLSGTGACDKCCDVSPFEVLDRTGQWTRAAAKVIAGAGSDVVELTAGNPILGIRLDWEGYPQCALYNGVGGPDDHAGLAASPFQWCAYDDGKQPWAATCPSHNPNDVVFPQVVVPSKSASEFTYAGGASIAPLARTDKLCTSSNLRTGNPGGVGVITSTHAIDAAGHTLSSLSMSFRYIAGYTPPAGQTKNASTVTVLLTDEQGKEIKVLYTSPPLGNYSYDVFTGFSPPITVQGSGLDLAPKGLVYLTMQVANNERNLQIAIDDMGSGWNITLGWA
jgi:hypothetical protein